MPSIATMAWDDAMERAASADRNRSGVQTPNTTMNSAHR